MFIKTREYQELFLEALRAGIRGQRVAWKERSVQEWSGVFALADMHHVLPLVYEAVAECRAAALADRVDRKSTRLNSSHGDESRMPSSA